jgi:hypothetical protein
VLPPLKGDFSVRQRSLVSQKSLVSNILHPCSFAGVRIHLCRTLCRTFGCPFLG